MKYKEKAGENVSKVQDLCLPAGFGKWRPKLEAWLWPRTLLRPEWKVRRQGRADANDHHDHHVTFFLSFDLLSRVLLQPFPLLALPTPHSPVPVQRRLFVNLKLLIPVSTELRHCSGFSPDIQPAVA